MVLLDALVTIFIECFFDIRCPVYLRGIEDNLTGMDANPLVSWFLKIVEDTDLHDVTDRGNHLSLDITHPKLNIAVFRVNFSYELNIFAFT